MTGQGLSHIQQGIHIGVQAWRKHHQRGLAPSRCRLGQVGTGLDAVDDSTFEAEGHLLKTGAAWLCCCQKIRT